MASRYPGRSKQGAGRLPFMSERQTQAYLVTREILRRIERSSALAYLTSDAVNIRWSGLGSLADGRADRAGR